MKKNVEQVIQRIPPQNIDAEQAVLGTILITGKIPANLLLQPEWFYKDHHRIIFSAMLKLSVGGTIDVLTVSNYLRDENKIEQIGGLVYLANLSNLVPSVSKIDEYAMIIRKKALLRKIIGTSHETMQISYEEQGDVAEILASWQRQLYEIQGIYGGFSGNSEMDLEFDNLLAGFAARETHLKCLNDAVGGLPTDDVTVIGADTSMGKTSLALGLMHHFAIKNGQRVAYFGAHLKKEDIYFRLLCAMSGIENVVLKRGKATKEQRQELKRCHDIINASPISSFTMPKGMSAIDIVSKTRALVEKYKEEVGVVIVENLQQLVWPEPTKTTKDKADLIFGCLKSLPLELNIPVVISSQVDRKISLREDKRPKPGDMVGTGDIERLARLVLLLYRDDYYHPEKIDSRDKDGFVPGEIIVYKTGITTTLNLRFNPLTFQWKDLND